MTSIYFVDKSEQSGELPFGRKTRFIGRKRYVVWPEHPAAEKDKLEESAHIGILCVAEEGREDDYLKYLIVDGYSIRVNGIGIVRHGIEQAANKLERR